MPEDLSKLTREGAVQRLTYVGDAITMMRKMLDGKVPLIGFTGAPVKMKEKFDATPSLIDHLNYCF